MNKFVKKSQLYTNLRHIFLKYTFGSLKTMPFINHGSPLLKFTDTQWGQNVTSSQMYRTTTNFCVALAKWTQHLLEK